MEVDIYACKRGYVACEKREIGVSGEPVKSEIASVLYVNASGLGVIFQDI